MKTCSVQEKRKFDIYAFIMMMMIIIIIRVICENMLNKTKGL